VRDFNARDRLSGANDLLHRRIGSDFPRHLDRQHGHAATKCERFGREPCPEHEPVGRRIARRYAERKRVGLELRKRLNQPRERKTRRRKPQAALEQRAAVNAARHSISAHDDPAPTGSDGIKSQAQP